MISLSQQLTMLWHRNLAEIRGSNYPQTIVRGRTRVIQFHLRGLRNERASFLILYVFCLSAFFRNGIEN
jgi:hypothetical protein